MALELNGTTGVSLVQDGVVVAADLNSALSDTIGKVKAWVNFDGTGTVAIRAGYNVSTITDNAVGDYTINFTTAMVDANYCVSSGSRIQSGAADAGQSQSVNTSNGAVGVTTTSVRVSSNYNRQTTDDVLCNI
jgi:hypothetical protein